MDVGWMWGLWLGLEFYFFGGKSSRSRSPILVELPLLRTVVLLFIG